jgi:hypothetical protein
MARLLLHYDIHDPAFRAQVHSIITTQIAPPFVQITESVYETTNSMIPREYQALVTRLKAAFPNPPAKSRIVLERPDAGPNIVSEVIVDA